MDDAANKARLNESALGKRIDLALRSDRNLLIVEFVRPNKPVDWDHLSRCQRYIYNIRAAVKVQTAIKIDHISGLLVADALDDAPDVRQGIESLHNDSIEAWEWASLISQAKRDWRDYFDLVVERTPDDNRVAILRDQSQRTRLAEPAA